METPSKAEIPAAPDPNIHPTGLVGAGFGIRAAAQLIDTALHYAVWFVASFVFILVMALTDQDVDNVVKALSNPSWFGYLAGAIGYVLYHAAAEGLNGATLGKRLLGLVVIGETGGPCTLPAAFGRSLAFYVDSLVFGAVAYGTMEPPYQQRLGDKWARTYVVRRASALKGQMQLKAHFVDALFLGFLLDAMCFVASALIKIS